MGEAGVPLIQSIAVIGAGPAGRAFAFRCAAAGFAVVLEDVMPSTLRRAQDEYAEWSQTAECRGSLRFVGTIEEAVVHADLAVDFVPDELESKLEIFSLLDRMAPPRTIFCTPTQVLSITDLASCTYRPESCVALRARGDELLTGSIPVVRGRHVEERAIEAVGAVLGKLGLAWIVVEDEEPMLVKNTLL